MAAGLFAAAAAMQAQISATATFTDTEPTAGTWDYDITLDNTGSTTIGTFWFSWIPGAGFMSATPTGISSPAGWTEITTNAGKAIQWKTSSALLGAGDSLSGFMFDSTLSPDQLEDAFAGPGTGTGDTVATSFVYIAAPLADPGYQFVVTPETAAVAPEPGSALLMIGGLGLTVGGLRRRRRN